MRADTRIEPQSPGVERPRRMPDGGASNAGGGKTELQGFPERNPSAVFPVLSTENCFIWSHRAVKRNGADVLKKRVLRHIFIKEKTIAGIRRAAFPACSCGKDPVGGNKDPDRRKSPRIFSILQIFPSVTRLSGQACNPCSPIASLIYVNAVCAEKKPFRAYDPS